MGKEKQGDPNRRIYQTSYLEVSVDTGLDARATSFDLAEDGRDRLVATPGIAAVGAAALIFSAIGGLARRCRILSICKIRGCTTDGIVPRVDHCELGCRQTELTCVPRQWNHCRTGFDGPCWIRRTRSRSASSTGSGSVSTAKWWLDKSLVGQPSALPLSDCPWYASLRRR